MRSTQFRNSANSSKFILLSSDSLQNVFNHLEAHDLASVAAVSHELRTQAETQLHERSSQRGHTYTDQDSIPTGFSTWASYLALVEWIALTKITLQTYGTDPDKIIHPNILAPYVGVIKNMLTRGTASVRIMALRTLSDIDSDMAAQCADAVAQQLMHPNHNVRERALRVLMKAGDDALEQYAEYIADMVRRGDCGMMAVYTLNELRRGEVRSRYTNLLQPHQRFLRALKRDHL
jgi:hypothetical protein